MNRKSLWAMCGMLCLAATSDGATVAFTEQIPPGVGACSTYTAPFTAGQGTCSVVTGANMTTATSVLAFSTTGATMAGLRVTAIFAGGVTETATWAGTGGNAGGASNNTGVQRWSLTNAGDTFNTAWILTNSSTSSAASNNITDIIISGVFGTNLLGQATIFDRTSNPDTSGTTNAQTPGSNSGHDLSQSGNQPNYNILVTYSNIFRVTSSNTCVNSAAGAANNQRPNAPCGDEWATMRIHFNTGGGATQFTAGSTFSFFQDADNTNGGLTLIPEPATISLLGLGLLGITAAHRRRKNRELASKANCG